MNFKFFGGLSALLLATALAGCTPSTSGAGGTSASGDALATVGSSNVTRAQLSQTLEGLYGDQVLPELIDTQLLTEAAKAKKLEVTDAEVETELARIQEQTPSVKTTLEAGGARVDVIKNQIRRNLTVQKLLTSDIASDAAKEQAFFKTYGSYYGTPLQMRLGLLAASTKVRADQLSRALKAKPDSFNALVEEQKAKAAQDRIAGASTVDTGRLAEPSEFGPAVSKALATAKKGTILPVQALAPTGPFLIVKVIDRKDASKPDFTKLQPTIATDYKMAQAAEKEIKKNPNNPQKLEQNIKQLIAYLGQPNPQTGQPGVKASLRDALTTILRPASNNLLEKLRAGGTVTISDAAYKEVAKAYQQPTAAPGAGGNTAAGTAPVTSTTPGHEGHDHP